MKARYRVTILIVVLLLAITTFLGTSYSIWTSFQVQEEDNIFNVIDCFELTFTEETDSINLRNVYPMSDIRGSQTSPYIFTVTNVCNHPINYKVVLNTLNTSNEYPELEVLEDQYIRVSLGSSANIAATDLNTFDTIPNPSEDTNISNSYVIYSDTLNARDEAKSYSLRLWVKDTDDGSTTNPDGTITYGTNVINKVFEGKLSIEASSAY